MISFILSKNCNLFNISHRDYSFTVYLWHAIMHIYTLSSSYLVAGKKLVVVIITLARIRVDVR